MQISKIKVLKLFNPETMDGSNLKSWLVVLIGAIAIALGFPNNLINCPLLIFLWPIALAYLGIRAKSFSQAFIYGFSSNFLGISAALYWLALPIREVGGLPLFGAIACALSVSACLAFFPTVFSLALFFLRKQPLWLQALLGALVWLLQELLTIYPAGFPWIPLTGALIVYPSLVQSSAYIGSNGTSALFILALNLSVLPIINGQKNLKFPALALAIFSILLIHGHINLSYNPLDSLPKQEDSLGVLFVEGNVDQNQKWIPSLQRQTVEHYLNLTALGLKKISDANPLIIWPETALPFFFETNPGLADLVRNFVRDHQSLLLFGAPGTDATKPKRDRPIYNRATLLGPEGKTLGHYDKEHLVPFGEYLPRFLDFSFLEPLLQGVGVYNEGQNQGPLSFNQLKGGILICYEGIFPHLAHKQVQAGANILIDISNDSWFSTTPASRQHLYLTCLRAIEQHRYILRGTNTGISAIIDPQGRIILHGQLFQATSFYGRARLLQTTSFFHKFCRYELYGVLLLVLAAIFFIINPKRSSDLT